MCAGSATAQGWVGVGGGMPPSITSIIKGLALSLHNAPYRTIAKAILIKPLICNANLLRIARLPCLATLRPRPLFPAAPPFVFQTVKKNGRSRLCRIPRGIFETNRNACSSFWSFLRILFSFINTGHCRLCRKHGLQFQFQVLDCLAFFYRGL